jgi:hypothetical protein
VVQKIAEIAKSARSIKISLALFPRFQAPRKAATKTGKTVFRPKESKRLKILCFFLFA